MGPGFSLGHEGWAQMTCDDLLLSHSAAGHRANGVVGRGQGW